MVYPKSNNYINICQPTLANRIRTVQLGVSDIIWTIAHQVEEFQFLGDCYQSPSTVDSTHKHEAKTYQRDNHLVTFQLCLAES